MRKGAVKKFIKEKKPLQIIVVLHGLRMELKNPYLGEFTAKYFGWRPVLEGDKKFEDAYSKFLIIRCDGRHKKAKKIEGKITLYESSYFYA